jgi:hypothetical protein
MTTTILFEDIRANKFKDTLFETVSHEPWSLEYKIIFLETRKELGVLITEWLDTCEKYMLLTEAADAMTDEQADEIINRFLARKTLPRTAIDNLHDKLSGGAEGKKGWLQKTLQSLASKFFAPIRTGLDKLNKITTYAPVDDSIQILIAKIDSKTSDKMVKKLLNMIRSFSKNKKASWLTSAVLMILGVVQSMWSLPFIGTTIIGLTVLTAAIRIISDLMQGKSIGYAVGKAVTLFGAGYAAKELFDMGMSLLNQVENLPIPPKPPLGDISSDSALMNPEDLAGPARPASAPPSAEEVPVIQPDDRPIRVKPEEVSVGNGPFDPESASLPSTGNPYIDKLQDLYRMPIKSYSGSFRDAFAAARKDLGSGGIFSWTDPATGQIKPFTTNTRGEGQFANLATDVVNYLPPRKARRL